MRSVEEKQNDKEEPTGVAYKYNKRKTKNVESTPAEMLTEYYLPSENLCFNMDEVVFSCKARFNKDDDYEEVTLSITLIQQIKTTYKSLVFASQKKDELLKLMEETSSAISKTSTNLCHRSEQRNIKALKYSTIEGYGYFIAQHHLSFDTTGTISFSDLLREKAAPNTKQILRRHSIFTKPEDAAQSYLNVLLPETLLQQVIELWNANIDANSAMETLRQSQEFITVCPSKENASERSSYRTCVVS